MSEQPPKALDRALGRIASGLSIVTVRKGDEVNAFLASWVQQAGFEPPMLTVAVGKDRPATSLLATGGEFCVNVIAKDDPSKLIGHFARGFKPGEDPYDGVEVKRSGDGPEYLPNSLATLHCQVRGMLASGDHMIVLGEVVTGFSHDDDADPATHLRSSGFRY